MNMKIIQIALIVSNIKHFLLSKVILNTIYIKNIQLTFWDLNHYENFWNKSPDMIYLYILRFKIKVFISQKKYLKMV